MVTKIGLSPAKRVHLKRQKALPFLTINGDDIAIFCHLKDVFCFADYRAKSDIFQRKNSKLQQILSVFKTLCPLTFAPPSFAKATDGKPLGLLFVDFFLLAKISGVQRSVRRMPSIARRATEGYTALNGRKPCSTLTFYAVCLIRINVISAVHPT